MATIACGIQPSDGESTGAAQSELGSCGPGKWGGDCQPCTLQTTGSLAADLASVILYEVGVGSPDAYYEITNNEGSFHLAPGASFPAPPSSAVSIGGFSGSFTDNLSPTSWPSVTTTVGYSVVVTNIPSLTLNWTKWNAGRSSIEIDATLSGTIDTHVTLSYLGLTPAVNPSITFTNLPITVFFGTDGQGKATITSSQVTVSGLGSFVKVNGCGVDGFCDGLIQSVLGSSGVSSSLQSWIVSNFPGYLNGAGPFYQVLMSGAANQTLLPSQLTDPSGKPLPTDGTSSPAGTVTSWDFTGNVSYANYEITAGFTGQNICYLDCTSRTEAQACGTTTCGTVTDGCGNDITCPLVCGTNRYCDPSSNTCQVTPPCIPDCNFGYICDTGVCVVNHRCPALEKYCNGQCIAQNALCPCPALEKYCEGKCIAENAVCP